MLTHKLLETKKYLKKNLKIFYINFSLTFLRLLYYLSQS